MTNEFDVVKTVFNQLFTITLIKCRVDIFWGCATQHAIVYIAFIFIQSQELSLFMEKEMFNLAN